MSESRAKRGTPPIDATSLTLTASALKPMSAGLEKRRSKCMPSTRASVVSTWRAPLSGAATAASSPIPMRSPGGAGGTRRRIRAISARSPVSETRWVLFLTGELPGELNGPCLPDHRDLDLARILQLVLDAARDILRQPHRLLVRDPIAFDDNPDF